MLTRSARRLLDASSLVPSRFRLNSSRPESSPPPQTSVPAVSMSSSSEFTVQHDMGEKAGEFYINMGDGKAENKAVLQYEWLDNRVLNFYHTGVPPIFRGKGIAKILTESALNFAVKENVKFIPTCSYVDKYVREINPKPEFTSRIAN